MARNTRVRVLVGTRKGGYIVESDKARRKWSVHGPFERGWDTFHVVADPRHSGHLYAATNSGFFGPRVMKSTNFGAKWAEIGTPLLKPQSERPNPMESPELIKWPVANLWHIEPGPASEPNTIFLGLDPFSLHRSDDQGKTWAPVPGINDHPTKAKWNPGNGGPCLHTILIDPTNSRRMYVGISAAGTFRSDDGGESWKPKNVGVEVDFLPDKRPEVGQCVHKLALDPVDPTTLYRQDHNGIHVSHDAGDTWDHVGKSLKDDFGFVVTAPKSMPGVAFFVPLQGGARVNGNGQLQVLRYTDKNRKFTPTIKGKPWPGELGTHREGMASDTLDPAGIYLGTTTGELFYSRNGGNAWDLVDYHFPTIHSVSVSSPD
jgi:BNR/Asp-box repeat protein